MDLLTVQPLSTQLISTMTSRHLILLAVILFTGATTSPASEPVPETDWRQFRGPDASGVGRGYRLPDSWNVETGDEVAWQTRIPGLGHSAVIVTGNRVFVTTAVSGVKDAGVKVGIYGNIASVDDKTVHSWRLLCLDLSLIHI